MKDRRYKVVKSFFEKDSIDQILNVFDVLPISTVAKDMGVNYSTLYRKIQNPRTFTIGDILDIAALIEIEPELLLKLIAKENKKKSKPQ
ncbi:hypothetical protein CLV59_101247 [Chitinophaga dinghuensis]|uniref:Cro/C1-type helix-turn-helix DNA-binding protein n=1 Tax=Chitinophaga dinghuensis TaxID=1539050 RepID=A0A327WDM0_9BACT|nr:hypothetical protein [Chitinophaga dinghuensis]RAJ87496.1 hypothetical protein CLV59_101247 [Chitinophaga dinghuensis]